MCLTELFNKNEIEFLTYLFPQGLGYSGINTAREALAFFFPFFFYGFFFCWMSSIGYKIHEKCFEIETIKIKICSYMGCIFCFKEIYYLLNLTYLSYLCLLA